jgi:hypothetical protein
MAEFPNDFPALPQPEDGAVWPANVTHAHEILTEAYQHGLDAYLANDSDAHRLRLHSERLVNRMFPILEGLEPEIYNQPWIELVVDLLSQLVVELERMAAAVTQV